MEKVNVGFIHYDEMVNGNCYCIWMKGFQLDDEHIFVTYDGLIVIDQITNKLGNTLVVDYKEQTRNPIIE